MYNGMSIYGYFTLEHYDALGNLIERRSARNMVTYEGMNQLLNEMFGATSKTGTWYIGLIDNTDYADAGNGIQATDDYDSIGGSNDWTEFEDYDETFRQEWLAGTASGQSIANSSTADFSINTDDSEIKGIFITNGTVIGDATYSEGVLFSTAVFSSVVNANDGDTLKLTYTLSLS